MKRAFDLTLALILLVTFLLPMLILALLVKLTSSGPVLYWSDRVGRGNQLFRMPKFRSMRTGTPTVATHLLTDSRYWITPIGGFLRKSSLDELPQLWSIFKGDMSFVGPRPALFNQHDLIAMRTAVGVECLTPGLTGWAQINGRDELDLAEKVRLDAEYLRGRSFWWDLRIMATTIGKVFRHDGIAEGGSTATTTDARTQRKAA